MEQTKALNALEPYLLLTKSATAPRAAAGLVEQATSNPNTYVFAELLQTPQIQALGDTNEYTPFLRLLEIFSYGTYAGYRSASANLPKLNDAQTLKLRQLSLLSLARDPHNLSYAALQQSLDLADSRAVEDLVVGAVYAGLVEAQLDPRRQTVHVSSVSPLRDLAPNSVPATLAALQAWSGRCEETLADLEQQVAAIKSAAARRQREKGEWEETQAALAEEERNASESREQPAQYWRAGRGGRGVHGRGQSRLLNNAISRLRGGGHLGQRSVKRGSGSLDTGYDDDEAMDVDEEEPDDGEGSGARGGSLGMGKQRASRRKL